jgi:hypothetical protein
MKSQEKIGIILSITFLELFVLAAGIGLGRWIKVPLDKTLTVYFADEITHKIVKILGEVNIKDKTEKIIVEVPASVLTIIENKTEVPILKEPLVLEKPKKEDIIGYGYPEDEK